MDIDIYFNKPGELPSDFLFLPEKDAFKSSLVTENYDVAIIGVKSELNSANKGAAQAPDAIRKHLYTLKGEFEKLRICDLGNIKKGNKPTDVRFALRDIIAELHSRRITTIVIGGTQELTVSIFDGLKEKADEINVSIIDAKADLQKDSVIFLDTRL